MYPVATMCRLPGVSASGRDAWQVRAPSPCAESDGALLDRIREIHRISRGAYGAPRIHADLVDRGCTVGRKRVARLMRRAGLRGHQPTQGDANGDAGCARPRGAGPGRARLHRRRTRSALERRHHLHPHPGRVPLPRRRAGCLQPPRGRLVHGQPPAHTARARCPRHGPLATPARRRDPPFRPGIAVHLDRLRQALPRRRRAPVHRIGRGLLRQRHVRELLRHPRMRAARPPQVPLSCRSKHGRLRVHRGMVQSTAAPLRHRIPVTSQLRTEQTTPPLAQIHNRPRKRGNSSARTVTTIRTSSQTRSPATRR